MPDKPNPGPYHSQLNDHLAEIAELRKTRPYPTPYKQIAKILEEKHGLKISANSIWSFVRTRSVGRSRPLKYRIDEDLIDPPVSPGLLPSTQPIGVPQTRTPEPPPSTLLTDDDPIIQPVAPPQEESINDRKLRLLLEEQERKKREQTH